MSVLISLLGGGMLRALPELIALWNKKTDNDHEYKMLDKQTELEKLKGENQQRVIEAQGQVEQQVIEAQGAADQVLALLESQKVAMAGQMQKTGIRAVDALNFLVRPLVTYYFVGMYGFVKAVMIYVALQQVDCWAAVIKCWSPDDAAILSGILAFWFVGRVFDKKQ